MQEALTHQSANVASSSLNGILAFILLLAVLLALPVSFALLAFYRRAVSNAMRTRAHQTTTDPATPVAATPIQPPTQTTPDVAVVDRASPLQADAEATDLHAETLRAPWRTAATYVFAGLCQALIIAVVYNIAPGESGFSLLSTLFMFMLFAWPAVLTVNLVATTTLRAKLATATVYFILFAVTALLAVLFGAEFSLGAVIFLWLVMNLPTTLLLFTFLNRKVRAVGPLVLIFMIIAGSGLQLALSALMLVGRNEDVLRSITDAGSFVSIGAVIIFFGLAIVGFLLAWPLGWLVLRWIRRRYEQKKVSDLSITVDAVWLLFGMLHSLILASRGDLWLFTGLFAFLGYKLVARVGFSLFGRRDAERKSTGLLLLRVFSLGKPSELLFGALAKHWRHVGSIQLITGYDLATETVEPHEFMDFLSRKLSRLFIDGAETLDKRIAVMDVKPDRDGRYRVNDFFCRDDTWKMVLSRLVSGKDVVLMDLRGFSSENAGCLFEINELINVVPLERVKFIIDDTTDEKFLLRSVQESWSRMRPTSPNRLPAHGQLQMFQFQGARTGDLRQILLALCVAAKAA